MQARNADLRCTLCKSRDKPLADPLTAPAGRQIDVQVCWVLPRQMREFGEIGDVRKKRIAGGIIEATDEIADNLTSGSERYENIFRVVRKVAAQPPLKKLSPRGLVVEAPATGLEEDRLNCLASAP